MAINLIDLVKDQLGGQAMGQISNLLGENSEKTTAAVGGAIPAILGGLMDSASSSDGAAKLAQTLDGQDDSLLDNLGGMLGGDGHQSMMSGGLDMVSSLFGGKLGGIIGTLSSLSGLGQGSSRSLLGLLAPIVMGVLGRQKRSMGLDAGGLANLLSGQKDNIAAAMPGEMSSALGISGLTGKLSGAAGAASDAVGSAAGAVGDAARSTADAAGGAARAAADTAGDAARAAAGGAEKAAAKSGSFFSRFLLPLVIIAALVWLALKFLGGGVDEAADAAKDAASGAADTAATAVDATKDAAAGAADAAKDAASGAVDATKDAAAGAADAAAGAADAAKDAASGAVDATKDAAAGAVDAAKDAMDMDIGGQLGGLFEGATSTLSGITDVDSANAALPQITEMTSKLDGLAAGFGGVSDEIKGQVAEQVGGFMPQLEEIITKLTGMEGVGDIIKPALDTLKEKLAAFM